MIRRSTWEGRVSIGDFNDDGTPDLAVANYGPSNQRATTVSVLVGNGDGTFQVPATFEVGRGPASVTADDVNGDGRLDLAVGNYVSSTVSVLLGNANGTFQPARNF